MTSIPLNHQQKEAVHQIDGPMMVLAGPGTGKTQIIAARIAQILQETQMEPHNILCLTFTESGVVAMRKRLIGIIGPAAYAVRIHTFHSFCNDVIKDFPEKFLFARELEALTDVERIQLFRQLIESLPERSPLKPFGDPYLYQSDLIRGIQNLKREDISPEQLTQVLSSYDELLENHGTSIEAFIGIHGAKLTEGDVASMAQQLAETPLGRLFAGHELLEKKERTALKSRMKSAFLQIQSQLPKQKILVTVYEDYQKQLRKRGRYDFEDMILFVVQKFQEDKELLAFYQEQFQYILVDEYQDTNGAQNKVVQLIAEFFENPNVFVVGDDKQSIYRFQGASLENLLFFYQRYKGHIKLVSLKENYRSQQGILDAAHGLIQKNEHGIHHYIPELSQSLHAAKEIPTQKIQVAEFTAPSAEHYFLAKRVQELIAQGCPASEIAILYRNNWDVQDLMELFLRLEVPFRLEAGVNILEKMDIRKLIGLLKLIENVDNPEQLFRVLHYDFLGFTALEVAKLIRAAQRKSLLDTALDNPRFEPFLSQCLEWKSLSMNVPFTEFFDHVIKESGFLNYVMEQPDKIQGLNRLNTLFAEVKSLNRSNHELDLTQFLAHLELLTENKLKIKEHELKTSRDAVRLMTAHKSKGLEFEHVFIMKCIDKHWGNNVKRSRLELPAGLLKTEVSPQMRNEDERRLFYVALTRAKQSVTLSYSNTRENGRPQVPSLFLAELDENLITRIETEALEDEALARLQTIFLEVPKEDHSEEEEAFVRSLLENYTLSVTHLNNYLRCPRLFYFQNILRVPSSKNKFAAFGTAVHESLKDLGLKLRAEEGFTREELLESFEQHLKREVLSQQDYKGGLALGQEALGAYFDNYSHEFNANIVPEYNFSSHGVHVAGVPITGKLDKIQLLDESERTVHVVDYKTGNPDSKGPQLKTGGDYHRQITFYKLLCDNSKKFPYTMVSGEIDFVEPSRKDGSFKKAKIFVKPEELAQLTTTIKDVYQDIMDLKFLHPDEWSTCGECEYCKT